MARLIVIPTPIGNLEDITLRALRLLKEADLVLAEDTRTTGKLFKHYEISAKLHSHHKFNEHKSLEQIVSRIRAGETIALVSDAGTPAISDPGFLIVRACVNAGIEVECLPGATAFVPALVVSGLPNDRFCFEGFLPQKKGRNTRLKELAEEKRSIVFYESPYRVLKTLEQLGEFMGFDRKVSVSREISKMFEQTVRGTLTEVIAHFKEKEPKCEFVLVLEGKENASVSEEEKPINSSKNKYKIQ
jgi:16S rRNA (cytidine1402-2'-O)-methyltransferase